MNVEIGAVPGTDQGISEIAVEWHSPNRLRSKSTAILPMASKSRQIEKSIEDDARITEMKATVLRMDIDCARRPGIRSFLFNNRAICAHLFDRSSFGFRNSDLRLRRARNRLKLIHFVKIMPDNLTTENNRTISNSALAVNYPPR